MLKLGHWKVNAAIGSNSVSPYLSKQSKGLQTGFFSPVLCPKVKHNLQSYQLFFLLFEYQICKTIGPKRNEVLASDIWGSNLKLMIFAKNSPPPKKSTVTSKTLMSQNHNYAFFYKMWILQPVILCQISFCDMRVFIFYQKFEYQKIGKKRQYWVREP